jgi:NDP-sugar pyrophosphorylase family protein
MESRMTANRAAACDLLVLCGGLGTRLRSVVSDRPKPMAMIDERPFVDFVIEHFSRNGIDRIILCTGYLGNHVDEWYGERPRSYELLFSHERSPLGTAGALRQAAGLLRSDPFMVVNGDSLIEVDPEALLEFHATKGGCASVTLVNPSARTDVGFISIAANARITNFSEKQSDASSRFHNAGVYVFERSLVERLPAHLPCSIETDLLPSLLSRGVFGFFSDAPLYDIGTPERLEGFRISRRTLCAGPQAKQEPR